MTLLLTMIPFYLLSNAHCLGMCGPLVTLIAHHPQRYQYFLGRLLSFTLIGTLCGTCGLLFHSSLLPYPLSGPLSILLGSLLIFWGTQTLRHSPSPLSLLLSKSTAALHHLTTPYLLNHFPFAPLLLGLSTVLLPCSQTLILFSTSVLTSHPLLGGLNAALFVLATTPALLFALLSPHLFFKREKIHTHILGFITIAIGILGILRGLAAWNIIPHTQLNLYTGIDLPLF